MMRKSFHMPAELRNGKGSILEVSKPGRGFFKYLHPFVKITCNRASAFCARLPFSDTYYGKGKSLTVIRGELMVQVAETIQNSLKNDFCNCFSTGSDSASKVSTSLEITKSFDQRYLQAPLNTIYSVQYSCKNEFEGTASQSVFKIRILVPWSLSDKAIFMHELPGKSSTRLFPKDGVSFSLLEAAAFARELGKLPRVAGLSEHVKP